MSRRSINFTGRVQGVGFRATTQHIARQHEVTGWVRNEPDGSVRCLVDGPDEAVEAFLRQVRDTMGRFIQSERACEVPSEGELEGFEVRFH